MAAKTKPARARAIGKGANGERELGVVDFCRTGADTIAGKYLRAFWHPVYRGADLARGQAKPIRIMGEDLTLYRGEDGAARVVAGRCAHRGAKLSIGWVEGNAIKCAYHGWAYDGDGRCVRQPAEPRPFCDKVSIKSYPTREYLGMIFGYFGAGEPPELPRYPEFENEEYFVDLGTNIWNCNYWAQLENALDIAHTEFLHWHFHFKTPERTLVEQTPFGVKAYSPGLSGVAEFYDTVYFHMPNTHEWVSPPVPGEKVGFFAKSWRIPRDDQSHIRFDLKVVPVTGEEKRQYVEREKIRQQSSYRGRINEFAADILSGRLEFRQLKAQNEIRGSDLVNIQDCTVMTSLEPMADRDYDEMLGQTDLGIAMLRRLWKQELQSFATGGKLTDWPRPATLWSAMTA